MLLLDYFSKSKIKSKVIIAFVLLVVNGCYGQKKSKKISVKDMQEDIDFFYDALQQTHPNCYIYLTKEQFDKKIDSLKESIKQPLTKNEFYVKISEFNQYLDLHTSIKPSKKQLKRISGYYNLPEFYQSEDTVFFYMKDGQQKDALAKYRLLKINQMDLSVIEKFFEKRRNRVEPFVGYNFNDRLKFYLVSNLMNETLILERQLMDTVNNLLGKKDTIHIAFDKKYKDKSNKDLRLRIDSVNKVAVMEINTFHAGNLFKFNDTLNTYFKKLKDYDIERLYVDVSVNSGGFLALEEDVSGRFFDDDKTRLSGNFTMKISKYRRKLKYGYTNVKDGDYVQKTRYFITSKRKNKYTGELYIIQSRYSFSAATCFASHLQAYQRAKIIGEVSQVKAVFTDPVIITLPKSKFLFVCATQFEKNVGKDKHLGVVPDIPYYIYNPNQTITVQKAEQMLRGQQ